MAAWKEFEILIAKIQKDTAPFAIVQHSQKVRGKSGRLRQLDVTSTLDNGLTSIFTVFECKRYTRKVGIEKVEAFATKCIDVNANGKVMVSNTGFDAGAVAQAKQHGITLLSYREAKHTDWQNLLGPDSWSYFYLPTSDDAKVQISGIIQGEQNPAINTDLPFRLYDFILDKKLLPIFTVFDFTNNLYREFSKFGLIGPFEFKAEPNDDVFIKKDNIFFKINLIKVKGTVTIREYFINLKLASGNVIEDVLKKQEKYNQGTSESISLNAIRETQEGRIISQEEFIKIGQSKDKPSLYTAIPDSSKFFRITLTRTTN